MELNRIMILNGGSPALHKMGELGRDEIHIRDKRRNMREKGEYEGCKNYRKYARSEFVERVSSM